jgi:hypothetical protein
VVCSAATLASLSPEQRERVISALQLATAEGGVHLVETAVHDADRDGASSANSEAVVIPIEELESRYRGWRVSLERTRENGTRTFLARKEAVA